MLKKTIWPIAWRNVIKNKKRSILFGFAIFFSCFLLLFSHAVFNGSGDKLKADTRETFKGHVGVYWTSIDEYEKADPARLFSSIVDVDKDKENRQSLLALENYLKEKKDNIDVVEPYILRGVTVYAGKEIINTHIYSTTDKAFKRLKKQKIYQPYQKENPLELNSTSVLISREFASTLGVEPGDYITIKAQTLYGSQNALQMKIQALYRNKAPWINNFIYASDSLARELLDYDADFFSVKKIYLKPGVDKNKFAIDLQNTLTQNGGTLTAEKASDIGQFFNKLSESQKNMFTIITIVIFIVIGLGMRSTMRMVLFQRMREFGTLRAIGFSRSHCLLMVVFEVFIIALLALTASVILVGIIVMLLNFTGVYVPPGPLQYMLGGDHFYLKLKVSDILLTVGLIAALTFFSTFKPAGILLYNRVTDILTGTQKRVFLYPAIIKNFIRERFI